MPFTPEDFYVGMIAYFTVNDLRKSRHIRTINATLDKKPRPFVCFAEDRGESYWTPLTTTYNRCKRTIDKKHLRHATGQFLAQGDLIVSDGLNTFAGPIEVFAKRSQRFDQFEGYKRPHLSPEGVAEVQKIVEVRGGMLPGTVADSEHQFAAAA